MEKFETLVSRAIPLDIENIDTDQIIPARFLKATDKKGFGDNAFREETLEDTIGGGGGGMNAISPLISGMGM